jgi:hypothetical protein
VTAPHRTGREEANARAERWLESERAYHARRHEANREAWRHWHLRQAESMLSTAAMLAEEHIAAAAALQGGEED